MDFQILGPLEVVEEGRSIPLGGPKQRAVLAILLLHANAVVSRERLIDELWGEQPPKTADATLRVFVTQLRKALRTGRAAAKRQILESRSPGYLVRLAADELDLARFERLFEQGAGALAEGEAATAAARLREALALWRGRALSDFSYEAFAQAPAARLEEMRLAALELRIEADVLTGHHAEVVGELQAAVRDHPFREGFCGQLMLALYRAGRRQKPSTPTRPPGVSSPRSWGSTRAWCSRRLRDRSFVRNRCSTGRARKTSSALLSRRLEAPSLSCPPTTGV